MQSSFDLKDSGKREQFQSGMVRDVQEGKVLYHLVFSGPMFNRWAIHLTKGAQKYSADNWMLASGEEELERFRASAVRHFIQWYNGDRDEDHGAAVIFNINGAEYVREKLNSNEQKSYHISGNLAEGLLDLGARLNEAGSNLGEQSNSSHPIPPIPRSTFMGVTPSSAESDGFNRTESTSVRVLPKEQRQNRGAGEQDEDFSKCSDPVYRRIIS